MTSSPGDRPESYQPHHSSLHNSHNLSGTISLPDSVLEAGTASGTSAATNKGSSGSGGPKRRKRALMVCLSIPLVFYALYGLVASTQDLLSVLRGSNDVAVSDSTQGTNTGNLNGIDLYDGSVSVETPTEHDAAQQRGSNPLFGLLTGGTFNPSSATSSEETIGLSSYLHHVASPHSTYNSHTQLPVLWTPGAPNYTHLVSLMNRCLEVVQASWLGRVAEPGQREEEQVVRVVQGDEHDRGRYVNVDMSTLHGVHRAKEQNLVGSNLVDIIVSPFLPEILDLFDDSFHSDTTTATGTTHHKKARLLLILQDTRARIQSSYAYLHGQQLFTGSYLEFISSEHILVNDYLVRILSGKWNVHQPLTHDDLHVAVQELQSKFYVGVLRHIRPYVEQLIAQFGWEVPNGDGAECMFPISQYDDSDNPVGPQPKPQGETELETQMREIIRNKNAWDVQLMEIFVKRWDEGVFDQ